MFLEISQNSQENTSARILTILALACNFIEIETLAQVFSCEFCETSKIFFFSEYVWPTAFKAGNLKLSEAATGDFQ